MKIICDQNVFSWQNFCGVSRYICDLEKGLVTESNQNLTVLMPLYVSQNL